MIIKEIRRYRKMYRNNLFTLLKIFYTITNVFYESTTTLQITPPLK